MKTYRLAAFAAVLAATSCGPAAAPAFAQAVVNVADPVVSSQRVQVTSSGEAKVDCTTGCSAASALAVGTNGATAPTSSMQIGIKDGSGNLQPVSAANPAPVTGTINFVGAGTATNSLNGKNSATDTTTTSLHGAVTSKSIYVTGWACSNSGATSVIVNFQDGSGGTTLFSIEVAAGGGNNMPSGGGAWFSTTAGNALFFAASGSTTTLYCGFTGFSQ